MRDASDMPQEGLGCRWTLELAGRGKSCQNMIALPFGSLLPESASMFASYQVAPAQDQAQAKHEAAVVEPISGW